MQGAREQVGAMSRGVGDTLDIGLAAAVRVASVAEEEAAIVSG